MKRLLAEATPKKLSPGQTFSELDKKMELQPH